MSNPCSRTRSHRVPITGQGLSSYLSAMAITWEKVGGDDDIENIAGSFVFVPKGDTTTAVTYSVDVTLKFVPSKRLINWGTAILMRQELKNFRKFAEKSGK